eukprot:1281262-Rhodomonas_salina.1
MCGSDVECCLDRDMSGDRGQAGGALDSLFHTLAHASTRAELSSSIRAIYNVRHPVWIRGDSRMPTEVLAASVDVMQRVVRAVS